MSLTPSITARNNIYLLEEATETLCVMLIGKNYISYAITNATLDTIYILNHFESGKKAINKNDFQSILSDPEIKKSKHVHIGLDTYKATLIPFNLYEKEHKLHYFNFLEDRNIEEEVLEHNITDSLVELFAAKKSTLQFLNSFLPSHTIYSASAALLRNYPSSISLSKTHNFFIAVKDDTAIITHYKQSLLQYHHVFSYQHELDILYHISNYVHVKQIDLGSSIIQIHGECVETELVQELLKNHFGMMKYCTRIQQLHYPDALYSYPTHYFYNLFSLFSCAL